MTGLLSGAWARGIDCAPLLGAAGLGDAHLDGRVRTPIDAYAALYNAVVDRLDDEGFGLFEAPVRRGAFEYLARLAVGAPTLGVALERAAWFLGAVVLDLEVRVSAEGAWARLEIAERRPLQRRAADPRRVFAFEWLLRLLHGLACWLAGRGLTLESVRFPYPRPAHAPEYARIYTEHSTFGARTLVATLDAALLGLPLRRAEADLEDFLDGAPGKIAMLYRRDREIARAVREVLAGSLANPPDLAAIARRLNLSRRTLHRRLAEEDTSYRIVREALRREHALQRIEKSELSVAEIAAEVGYSEPSAFFRAFVGWTGVAPSLYRKRNKTLIQH